MKVKSKHIFIPIVLSILSSCLREPLPPENKIITWLEPDVFAIFCNAKQGSKFIYERERDGALDTVTVTSYSDARCNGGKGQPDDMENYIMRYNQCVFISYRSQKNFGADIRVTAMKNDSALFDLMSCGVRNRYKGIWDYGETIDSMNISGRMFKNILHFHFGCATQDLYFVKDIGIVRKVYNYQEIYNLKEWQIK